MIWPDAERLESPDERRRKRHAILMAGGFSQDEALATVYTEEAARQVAAAQRSLDIALAHHRIRARMQRFLAWLRLEGKGPEADFAAKHLSPEAAAEAAFDARIFPLGELTPDWFHWEWPIIERWMETYCNGPVEASK